MRPGAATPAPRDADGIRRAIRRAVPALGVTGIVNWGTTYYLPAVLRDRFQAYLGLSDAQIFAGVAVTLIVAAVLGWPAGRLIDRLGAKRLLPIGSCFLAAGLAVLATCSGAAGYFAAWGLFGIGMALGMSAATLAALTQIAGQGARRPISLLMLFGGMAATVFWPITLWLDGVLGWRMTLLVYAGLHLLVCGPLHLTLPGRTVAAPADAATDKAEPMGALVPTHRRARASALIAVMLAGNGFVTWGLDLHLIAFFRDYGLTATAAVALAAAKGPFTLVARVTELTFAGRVSALAGTLVGAGLLMASLMLALVWREGWHAAALFLGIHAMGAGLLAVSRATLPLAVLGAEGYATTLGKIALPTQIVYALAPMIFTVLIERLGGQGALVVATGASLASLGALLLLRRELRMVAPSLP